MASNRLILLTAAMISSGMAMAFLTPSVLGQNADVAKDSGSEWADVVQSGEGVLRVLYVPAAGFADLDEDGQLTGVTVEIVRDFVGWVSEEHGVELAVDFVAEEDWRTFYERVRMGFGGLFGLGNVTITEDRRDELQFSPSYLSNVAVLISPAGIAEIKRLKDVRTVFADLEPLAFQGTLHEERLRDIRDRHDPEAALSFAASNDEIIARVADGGFYAYVDGYNFWRAEAAGVPVIRHPVGDDPAEQFGIIFPLNSDWTEAIEAFFAAGDGYTNSERYRRLLHTHLGQAVADALLQD